MLLSILVQVNTSEGILEREAIYYQTKITERLYYTVFFGVLAHILDNGEIGA